MEHLNNKDKLKVMVVIVIEIMFIALVVCACVAFTQAINAQAMTPYIDGATGEWVIMDIHTQDDAIDITEPPPISNVSNALDAIDEAPRLEYLGTFFETLYCSGRCCNGKYGAMDGFGNPLEWGCVAVDPRVIPLHTKLVIEGYEGMIFEARDTGSHVNGHHIDIFWPGTHKEALARCDDRWLKVWKVK